MEYRQGCELEDVVSNAWDLEIICQAIAHYSAINYLLSLQGPRVAIPTADCLQLQASLLSDHSDPKEYSCFLLEFDVKFGKQCWAGSKDPWKTLQK